MNSRTVRLLLAIVVLAAALLFVTKDTWESPLREWLGVPKHVSELAPPSSAPPSSDEGKTFAVKRVQVLKGDQFDLVLENESRILAKLSVRTADQAKAKVIDLLNNCENPKVRLVKKEPDGQWLIDFRVTQSGKEVDLATWLSDNKLVYK